MTVQFWLLGLDARQGHLLLRGFQKRPASQGSSAYVLDTLTLHSSGLWVQRGKEVLHFNRRTHLYTLDDRLVLYGLRIKSAGWSIAKFYSAIIFRHSAADNPISSPRTPRSTGGLYTVIKRDPY